MLKNILTLLLTITFLAACSNQKTIYATGDGDLWKAQVTYEVTDSKLSDRGGIEYKGDEELLYVTYSLVTDEGRRDGERKPSENQTAIDFGTGVSNTPPTIDNAKTSLNHAYIEIKWRTNTGEYEEKIYLKVN